VWNSPRVFITFCLRKSRVAEKLVVKFLFKNLIATNGLDDTASGREEVVDYVLRRWAKPFPWTGGALNALLDISRCFVSNASG
jgi:hypothetical protein